MCSSCSIITAAQQHSTRSGLPVTFAIHMKALVLLLLAQLRGEPSEAMLLCAEAETAMVSAVSIAVSQHSCPLHGQLFFFVLLIVLRTVLLVLLPAVLQRRSCSANCTSK